MKEERYVVAEVERTIGNSILFHGWVADTCDIRYATIYRLPEALAVCSLRGSNKMFRLSDLLKLVQHHVSFHDTKRIKSLQRGVVSVAGAVDKDMYVVVDSRSVVGNSVMFWCWDGSGYTCDLRMAAVFPHAEAQKMERMRGTDKMYPLWRMIELAQHHVDHQDLYDNPMREHAHTFSHLSVSK